jgi:hypothetical protein
VHSSGCWRDCGPAASFGDVSRLWYTCSVAFYRFSHYLIFFFCVRPCFSPKIGVEKAIKYGLLVHSLSVVFLCKCFLATVLLRPYTLTIFNIISNFVRSCTVLVQCDSNDKLCLWNFPWNALHGCRGINTPCSVGILN